MKKDQLTLSKSTPHKSAEKFRELVHPTLINVSEDWLTYDERGPYVMIDNDAMTARIRRFLISARVVTATETSDGKVSTSTAPFNPKKNDVAEVYAALFDLCYRDFADNTPPCWLDKEYSELDPSNLIACRNGLLDMTTLQLYEHTPLFFTRSALPIDFDADAPEPARFLQFLDETMKGRKPLINLVQEMMGYLLTADTEFEIVFYLIGKSRGGKGTLIKIIKALVGDRNVAAPTIRSFASQYWAWPLMDKSLGVVTDVAITDREAVKLAANHVNMVSGRDPVLVERKYKAPIMNFTLPTRVLMAGNFLPDFGEHAEALLNRLIAIPFDVSFAGRADKSLARRMIRDELPGILLWALKGLARLRERGRFDEPAESLAKKGVLRNLANPTLSFVQDCCVVGAEYVVSKSALYDAYRAWCERQGIRGVLALKDFAQRVYETVEGSSESKPRVDGVQVRSFAGLTLNNRAASDIVPTDTLDAIDEWLDLGTPPAEAIELVRMAREREL
jgi:putative DNA primase/helicase